ncbi:MAG: HNH endonuclease [Armatimonadota bacterium]
MSSETIPRRLRQQVFARAKGRCEYCLFPAEYSNAPMHCEHIIPKSKGGTTTLENLALACAWCNGYKGTQTSGRDPRTGRKVRLFHPRKDRWERHFRWSEDGIRIIGKTSIGRATVAALRLNREELVRLRQLLVAVGEHPPKENRKD